MSNWRTAPGDYSVAVSATAEKGSKLRRSSYFVLAACVAICIALSISYAISRGARTAHLGRPEAAAMLNEMRSAVKHKDVGLLMECISSDSGVHVATLRPEQLRLILAHAFRNSGSLDATYTNLTFTESPTFATVEFDLVVKDSAANMIAEDYAGHITLRLKSTDVSHLLGLYHTREWRIIGGETTGRDPASFGDYF